MANDLKAWHYYLDALPSVARTDGGGLALRVVIGTWTGSTGGPAAHVEVDAALRTEGGAFGPEQLVVAAAVDRASYAPFTGGPPGRIGERVCRTYAVTGRMPVGNLYYEAVIPVSRAGDEVRYVIRVSVPGGPTTTLGPFRVVVAEPTFAHAHLVTGRSGEPTWLAYVKTEGPEAEQLTHLRLDLDEISVGPIGDDKRLDPTRFGSIPVRFCIDGTWLDVDPVQVGRLTPPEHGPQLPLVDWASDRLTLTVRGVPRSIRVEVAGRTAQLQPRPHASVGTTRVLIEHFAIQGLNDLLERPLSGTAARPYDPPRTYIQVTMSDDRGAFSSRPDVKTPDVDGYCYGFDAHRRFGVPYEIALNGGLLTLLAHDCRPEEGWYGDGLVTMRADIAAGLLHPTVAGYGSHRVPYYSAETNRNDILRCMELEQLLLGTVRPVFYPDQRLYRQGAHTAKMLTGTGIRYVVLDSDSGYARNVGSLNPKRGPRRRDLTANLLWQDAGRSFHALFIDDALKDLVAAEGDYVTPKPALELRRRLMRCALDPHLAGNLLVYGDDFEKACGNGWFEGQHTRERFCAFLEWASADRPWLRFVTTVDLQPALDGAGTIDIKTSTDPMLGYDDSRSGPRTAPVMQFDYWEQAWRDYPAVWTGSDLGQVTKDVESALMTWGERNALWQVAWLAFLSGQHENAWNKAPEGFGIGAAAIRDPEDFTVVEGLQIRNVFVWLKASLWASWAKEQARDVGLFVNGGPVHRRIDGMVGTFGRHNGVAPATHWDADPLETVTLYNDRALVVLDANGGRVTHAFVMDQDGPRAVSGTFKCYQYTSATSGNCDGPVIQNTVWTPNHRYIAADLNLDRGQVSVDWENNRPGVTEPTHPLLLPDNLNAYEPSVGPTSVTMTYRHSPPPQVRLNQADYRELLRRDGYARRCGPPTDRSVWHGEQTFRKTFTLTGTTLRVDYAGAPHDRLIVDNEFCVDLLGGAMCAAMLSREPAPGEIVIRSSLGGAVAVHGLDGCHFSAASLVPDVAAVRGDPAALGDFLEIHRVLTEAVQVCPEQPDFGYTVELDHRPAGGERVSRARVPAATARAGAARAGRS